MPVADRERWLITVTMVVALPIFWLGYGTDLDVAAVLRVGEHIRDGGYEPSRTPGVPVFEAIVAVLESLGGHLAINLATVGALVAAVVGCARLVRAYGRSNGELVALALLASPVTIIAGTSTADFIWALAFFVWGAIAHLRHRSLLAGLLLGLSIGARSSTALLVAAFVIAEAWPAASRRRALVTGAVAVAVGAVLYVPSWLSFDRTLGFVDGSNGWNGIANNAGRFFYKNHAMVGIFAALVLLTALPALARSLRRWTTDPLVRFATLGLLLTEGLFFVVPWKLAHLLPALLLLLLWIAATELNRPARLWLLIGALAVNGLVAVRPLLPDDPDAVRSAAFEPAITVGYLVNDVRCRIRHMDEAPRVDSLAWPCTLEPLRGPSTAPSAGDAQPTAR